MIQCSLIPAGGINAPQSALKCHSDSWAAPPSYARSYRNLRRQPASPRRSKRLALRAPGKPAGARSRERARRCGGGQNATQVCRSESLGPRCQWGPWVAAQSVWIVVLAAHAVDDKTEAAYRRSDMFDKRRRLLDAWAAFCGKMAECAAAKVVS
jgi:hypothetical protein